ncbi:hypothetical protein MSG28_013923 [Choristoneura fumiferana]|uniref:Uncharacterized protein n=1 Tax=Choristoneura fumiferana TaxID=7141 RepID=A0ACC0K9I3_CHOFU|nr:hypothetical protein MSG28_013923 [Choristoneura fumiferana]
MLCCRKYKVFHSNYKDILTKCVPIGYLRMKSTAKPRTKVYSHTILFPKTDFPARSNSAKKDEIEKTAKFAELYNWQRKHLKGPEFVLHDGPPYANGDLHMGHAVNKIIKDINNRYQILQGNKVHYVPGWDCHGLPIELKALQQTKKAKKNEPSDPVEIRETARAFALETIERQKEQFISWGVMADWDKQCYKTLDNSYVKKQLELFYEMYEAGLIFRALKPVYWSPSSRTALAEAELEYDPQFKSTEAYVSFPLEEIPEALKDVVKGDTLSAIIWTTTPWTLPANRAICFNPSLVYSVVALDGLPGRFLVAAGLLPELQRSLGRGVVSVAEFEGQLLRGARYRHAALGRSSPLLGRSFPLLGAAHVSATKGTGLVHTAPAHGPEDFLVGLEHNIPVECNVDESGLYSNLGPGLDGLPALGAGQEAVLAMLGPQLLRRGTLAHSHPLDWRTKRPVILRASEQWFVHTDKLKTRALEAIEQVQILPAATAAQSRLGFRSRVGRGPTGACRASAPGACPYPVCTITGGPYWTVTCGNICHGEAKIFGSFYRRIIDRLYSLLETRGPDAWWSSRVAELLPRGLAQQLGLQGGAVTKGTDIMDIWLDSGSSWLTLPASGQQPAAALYCEGVDQLTGWFQSSLLTSVAVTGRAPYECIFVHGFVVDSQRRKMSKSVGNVVAPADVIRGGDKQPAYGIDTLRWWVASHGTQHTQIIVSKQLLDDCQAEVIRLRAILKYLLGVIDLHPQQFQQKPPLNYLDKYMIAETYKFRSEVKESYKELRFNNAVQSILFFVSNKVSALYCHCVKDRLYCAPKDSKSRLAAQLVAHTILASLCKTIGPILPHLVEEAWQYHPLYEKPYFYTQNIPVLSEISVDTSKMETVLELKKDICAVTKNENLKRYAVNIKLNPNLFCVLDELNKVDDLDESVLCEILEVSAVSLEEDASVGKWEVSVVESRRDQCLRCRKYNAADNTDKCLRCEKAVSLS